VISDDLTASDESDDEDSEESDAAEVIIESKAYYWLAIRQFLESQAGDCSFFLNGKRTNHTESFHNVCNLYCPKGSNISTKIYVMKKQFAALHWGENKLAQLDLDDGIGLPWKVELLKAFLIIKRANSVLLQRQNSRKKLRLDNGKSDSNIRNENSNNSRS